MWEYNDELYHYGVLGMKWGRRRYQNKDGTLTPTGRSRNPSRSNSSTTRNGRKQTTKSSTFTSRHKQIKEDVKSYRTDKGPRRWNVYNAANSAARSYYRQQRTNDFKTYKKQSRKLDLKTARLTDEQIKAGRYRVARARNIKRKSFSALVGTATGAGLISIGMGAVGIPAGVATAAAFNMGTGGHYYSRQKRAYGTTRSNYAIKSRK